MREQLHWWISLVAIPTCSLTNYQKREKLSAVKQRNIHVKIPKRRSKVCMGGSNFFFSFERNVCASFSSPQ